jgi:hypothetical protein
MGSVWAPWIHKSGQTLNFRTARLHAVSELWTPMQSGRTSASVNEPGILFTKIQNFNISEVFRSRLLQERTLGCFPFMVLKICDYGSVLHRNISLQNLYFLKRKKNIRRFVGWLWVDVHKIIPDKNSQMTVVFLYFRQDYFKLRSDYGQVLDS